MLYMESASRHMARADWPALILRLLAEHLKTLV